MNAITSREGTKITILQPEHDEIVVDKDRFCAFSGNDLKEILRSGGIKHLVMAGVATSGVILSTFTLAADEDYNMTILSDACADPKTSLHEELMTGSYQSSKRLMFAITLVFALPVSVLAQTAQVAVLTSGGFSAACQELVPQFEKSTGITVTTALGVSQDGGSANIDAQLHLRSRRWG